MKPKGSIYFLLYRIISGDIKNDSEIRKKPIAALSKGTTANC